MKPGSLILVLALVLAALGSNIFAQSLRIPLRVAPNGGAAQILWFGVDTAATFCNDPELGEDFLPPTPPFLVFDTRFVYPRSGSNPDCFDQGMLKDIRTFVSTTQIDTYKIRYQGGYGGSPVRFSWPDLNPYYTNHVWLRFPINGSIVNVNMKTDTVYMGTEEIGSLYIVTGDPGYVPPPPETITDFATMVTGTSSRLYGSVNPNGYAATGWFEWGTSTSYGNATAPQSMGSGSFPVQHNAQLAGLSPGVTYHYRCKGQNVNGTTSGNDQSFTTVLDTISPTRIPIHVSDNRTDIINLMVGVDPSATFCLDPLLGEAALPPPPPFGIFDVRLVYPRTGNNAACFDQGTHVDLRPYIGPSQVDTFKIKFQSSYGDSFTLRWPDITSYFNDPVRLIDRYGGLAVNVDMKAGTSFTLSHSYSDYINSLLVIAGTPASPAPPPAVMTNLPENVVYTGVQLDGVSNPNGFAATGWFEWGTDVSYGHTTPVQPLGNGTTTIPIAQALSGLSPGISYHYRAVAQNTNGRMDGPDRSFSTQSVTNQYGMVSGWNTVSLPMIVGDARTTVLFPTAVSEAFMYQDEVGYVRKDTLTNGEGYWLKFSSAQNVSITGMPVSQDTIDIKTGWNLIGSITSSVSVSAIAQIPPGIVESPFFEFNGFYITASTLEPGKAYWVKSGANGQLVLSSGSILPSRVAGKSR